MRLNRYGLFSVLLGMLMLGSFACQKPTSNENTLKTTAYEYNLREHFTSTYTLFDNTPENNSTTVKGLELGRYLLYNNRISNIDKISYSTCHKEENAFADPDQFHFIYSFQNCETLEIAGTYSQSVSNIT